MPSFDLALGNCSVSLDRGWLSFDLRRAGPVQKCAQYVAEHGHTTGAAELSFGHFAVNPVSLGREIRDLCKLASFEISFLQVDLDRPAGIVEGPDVDAVRMLPV